jgi:1-aminocyclopropane-1-carboxylate deaminase/D-cysteine desulfhydrase-like pyridoxal-dependent ACC family enzyme
MSTVDELLCGSIPSFETLPRAELVGRATALESLPRLGEVLGVKLDAKRDDAIALGMGGNKVRQLEYYLGDAVAQGADTVLITGAVQSNFVRLCAAGCRRLGLHPVIQLEHRVNKSDPMYASSGNVLLDKLFGADIHYFQDGNDEKAADANMERLASEYAGQGRKPYVIHLGMDSPPIGAAGYIRAAAETFLDYRRMGEMPDHVLIASGSGLTHVGFLLGARAVGWDVPVHGICVRRDAVSQAARVRRRAAELAEFVSMASPIKSNDFLVYDKWLAPGYGQLSEHVYNAISLAATSEGLLLDPVYSGKTMAGLIGLIDEGVIRKGDRVAFIHTGGLPAIFGYQADLLAQANREAA